MSDTVFGIVTAENSTKVPEWHCTVTKDVDVAVRTHVCARVLLAETEEMEKPLGQQAAAVSSGSIEYSTPQPDAPPAVATAAVE